MPLILTDRLFKRPSEDAIAETPPMGWNSWNAFGKHINEEVVRQTIDSLVKSGLLDLGYQYVVIDDHWHGGRGENGILFEHPIRFPSGMKALAKYAHDRDVKFGIYSCAGSKTCGEEPGSFGYEMQDAELFAEYEVDFLKYDYCFAEDCLQAAIDRYGAMGDALGAIDRPIVYSICEWGARAPWLWAKQVGGHLWRTSYDVVDVWDTPRNVKTPIGVLNALDATADKEGFCGPGGWNDPDMLIVGLKGDSYVGGRGCTTTEYRSQMSLWCLLASPLMITCDLRHIDRESLNILSNAEVIAINQDPLGKQAFRVARDGAAEVWAKPLSENGWAIGLLNRDARERFIRLNWVDLGIDKSVKYEVTDVWADTGLGEFSGMIGHEVAPHACQLFRMTVAE